MLQVYIDCAPSVKASSEKEAKQILQYLFPNRRGFAIDQGSIVLTQNMTLDEAHKVLNPNYMPPVEQPKAKPKKIKVVAKPKKTVKKTTVKSKVKVKPKKVGKKTVKKTTVKSKPKKKLPAKKVVAKRKKK